MKRAITITTAPGNGGQKLCVQSLEQGTIFKYARKDDLWHQRTDEDKYPAVICEDGTLVVGGLNMEVAEILPPSDSITIGPEVTDA